MWKDVQVGIISQLVYIFSSNATHQRHTVGSSRQVEGRSKAVSLKLHVDIDMSDKTCIALFDYKGEGGGKRDVRIVCLRLFW